MNTIHVVRNAYGQMWSLSYHESACLTHIDGFLMAYDNQGSITLSTFLDAESRQRGLSALQRQLIKFPLGTTTVILWHRDDPALEFS